MSDATSGRPSDGPSPEENRPLRADAPQGDAHDDLADSHDIDEIAGQNPSPRHATGAREQPGPVDPLESRDGTDGSPPPFELPFPEAAGVDAAAAQAPDGETGSGRRGRRTKKQAKPHRKAPWWELPALIGLAIVIAIAVKTFLIQPFYIPSGSMEKTLHGCPGCAGDRILVSKIIYDFRDPEPGDIVVFNAPPGWDDGEERSTPPSNPILRVVRGFGQLIGFVPPDGLVLVKRVIAPGGQTVKGDAAGHVFISNDGPKGHFRELHEGSYVYQIGGQKAKFGPVTVPKGRLWVMGDHRNDSADSRFHCEPDGNDAGEVGCPSPTEATVPISKVIGKAFVIAWPPSRWRTLGTPTTFESASSAAADGVAASGLLPFGLVVPLFYVRRRQRRIAP